MRLIECYIENFGTLHDFHYSFTDGLNVLNQDNGFGKTTLSVFIKAMFYGLDDTKKTKLEENDRRHYMPWQGGVFGGWLTFTTGTLGYKVERTFGAKASDDTYTLYELETGKVSLAYQTGLGERIFGIDADGFERTLFLSERRLSQKSDNKSVSAKLSDLVGCDFDLGELDNALSMLEERRKYYYKKGGSGKIGDIKGAIATNDAETARIKRICDTIPEWENKITAVQGKINENQTLLSDYSIRAGRAQSQLAYAKKKSNLEELEAALDSSNKFFENGIPDEGEIIDAERAHADAKLIKESLTGSEEYDKKRVELSEKITKAEGILSKFDAESQRKTIPALHIPAFILAALLAIAGTVLSFGIAVGVGIGLLVCGAALSVIALVIYIKRKSGSGALDELYNEAKLFLDRCGKGYAEKESYKREIDATRTQLYTERALLNERTKADMGNKARALALENRYTAFLEKYKTTNENPFAEIREKLASHKRLTWRYEDAKRDLNDFIRINGIDTKTFDAEFSDAEDILAQNPEELKVKISELNREKALLEREYRDALDEAARLDELLAKRDELTDELHSAEDKYKTINLTREHLNAAKDRLTTKYLGKTREAFSEYIALMTGEAPELFNLSVEFGIMRSIGSVSKPEEAYSLGTREIYSLAARLALCDSLYDVDKPFIVLDDPFVHLDDKKYASATKIIKRLAQGRQIIYLTCSKSRAI